MTGIIEAEALRSEQLELAALTSDPANTAVGEYWLRVDRTGSSPSKIAELRRQDSSGVTTAPVFDSTEESNLAPDVKPGLRIVLPDGTSGFLAVTEQGGAIGSPRAVDDVGEVYETHDSLTLGTAIPDSVVNRWPLDEGSGTTAADVVGGDNLSISGATWVSDSDAIGGFVLSFDGSDDVATSGATPRPGSMTMAMTVDADSDISDLVMPQIFEGTDGPTGGTSYRGIRYRGDQATNKITFSVRDDAGDFLQVSGGTIASDQKHRIVGIVDADADQLRVGVNGSIAGTLGVSGSNFQSVVTSGTPHSVGARQDNFGHFDGNIDEPLQDSGAWTDQQVTDDYNRQPWS